jgi:hypothetical protein
MKNIHIIPTDKPSRLLKTIPKGNLILSKSITSGSHWENQNIYITSDEEIEEGDWFYDLDTKYVKIKQSWENSHLDFNGKKIILTTDKDLIKEGIQPIYNEFLEWFCNNSSCDWVKVKKECCGQCDERLCEVNDLGRKETKENTFYKIIIPKEEQKQHIIDMMKADEELGLYDEPKQICECIDECLGYLTKECKRIEEINKLDEIIKK